MNRLLNFIGVLVLVAIANACLIKPPPPPLNPWSKALDFETNTPVRNMFASPVELQVITDDEYIRMGPENVLKERRPIAVPFEFFGRPILSNQTFTRLVRTQPQGSAEIEIHLSSTPGEIFRITYEDLKSNDTEIFIPVAGSSTEYPAVYNDIGSQLFLPVINFSGNSHTFFLFDVKLDFSSSAFEDVSVNMRVDIPELPASTDRLTNVNYINGNYYVVTKDGAFRITPDGNYEKVIATWLYDFFEVSDTLFASGRGLDLHYSTDNGANWVERDSSSEIRFATVVQDKVYSQRFVGDLPDQADANKEGLLPLELNEGFPGRPTDAYSNILYFYNGFYLSIQKEVYNAEEITIQEE